MKKMSIIASLLAILASIIAIADYLISSDDSIFQVGNDYVEGCVLDDSISNSEDVERDIKCSEIGNVDIKSSVKDSKNISIKVH